MSNAIDKIPPHNSEAEEWVLGAILLDNDSILKASDIIQPHDFYRGCNKTLYEACLELYHDGESIDLITLPEHLRSKGQLENCGGISYIAGVVDSIPTAANIKHYANIIKEKSTLRRIIKWAASVQDDAMQSNFQNLNKLLNTIEKDFIDISQSVAEKKSPDAESIILDLYRRWQQEKDGQRNYIPVDSKLEKAIPRYNPGHLWIVGGYTSVGKSTFIAQQIVDVCIAGAKCLVFSLEDSREDKLIKLIANVASIGQRRLMTNDFDDCKEDVKETANIIGKWGVQIYDDVYDIHGIRLKIKKHKLQQKLDIVFIDYIQNISGQGSLYERISDAIINLQAIAKEMQVTIVVVSQVSNEAMRANSEIIGLKGAGELAAAADIVLWLKRVKGEYSERFLDCEIRKNRPFGMTGVIHLMFSQEWARIQKREIGVSA